MKSLRQELKQIIRAELCSNTHVYTEFEKRLEEGKLIRDEDPRTHFCVYILPYNSHNRTIFLAHHKKANMWIAPGGHIDSHELPGEAVVREAEEELGLHVKNVERPFMLSFADLTNKNFSCQRHYDIWYSILVTTDVHTNNEEFYETRWLLYEDALSFLKEKNNIAAVQRLSGK